MNKSIPYFIGSVILFTGLLWIFLPHAFHEKVTTINTSHLFHTVQGLIIALIGLALLILSNKNN